MASVSFPEGLTSIGGHAFRGATSLASVSFSESLTSIGWGAFQGATALALALLSQEKNVEMVRVILEQSRRPPQGDTSAKDWQALMHELAMACMSPANLQDWLRDGLASPAGLKGEIGALLLMSDSARRCSS